VLNDAYNFCIKAGRRKKISYFLVEHKEFVKEVKTSGYL
jgi:hypothetical protein